MGLGKGLISAEVNKAPNNTFVTKRKTSGKPQYTVKYRFTPNIPELKTTVFIKIFKEF